jgi:HAMP domain-containing protein
VGVRTPKVPGTRPHPRGPARWSLLTRLLASAVALLAAVSLVMGIAGVVALDTFLTARLDDQLTAAVDRSARGFDDGAGRPQGGPPADRLVGPLQVPGQAEGTLGVLVDDGTVISSRIVERSGELTTVPAGSAALLADVPVDGHPHTVELGDDLGDYRVVASEIPRGATFVTGLPLSLVDGPVSQLAGVVVAVGLAGLLVAGVVGALIIGRALRPLRRVASTATRVAEMPLDRGEVALAVRVPAVDTDPRTEVGRVGAALNHLLENVATALAARQASETRVRQFVADASHELRTPLAAIRGYAELTRRSRNPVPADVAHALRRVESEAVRMTVWSTTSSCLPGWTPAARSRARRSTCPPSWSTPWATPTWQVRNTDGPSICPTVPSSWQETGPDCIRSWRTCWPTRASTLLRTPPCGSICPHRDRVTEGRRQRPSASSTTGRASRPISDPPCSTASPAATAPVPTLRAAPGWGLPSWRPSSQRTTVTCPSTAGPDARRSPSGCRWPPPLWHPSTRVLLC